MFSSRDGCDYKYKTVKTRKHNSIYYNRYAYTFRSRSKTLYIVYVDELKELELCFIKFLPKVYNKAANKYKVRTNLYEMPSIISTCLNILIDFYKKNPYRSFGFIGENDEGEPIQNTKRYRLYRKIVLSLFSPETFKHICDSSKSVYILLNVNHQMNNPNLAQEISDFLQQNHI